MLKFVGVPRSVVDREVGEMAGWRAIGERMLQRAKALCPVGEEVDGWQGPHLRDTLELRVITGTDPRLLIGSKTKGEVLGYLIEGTSEHFVEPVNAKALRFTKGGTVYFSAGHMVAGITANNFVLQAITEEAQAR